MISKVILKNWRSHFVSELEFSEGTNCLIGRMGSGKSSVMDAICFGLFGTFPALQQRKIKLEDAVMKKPKKQHRAEVEIFFEINNEQYSVKRVIEKGRSSSELRRNGQLIEAPQSQKVTEEIEKLIKMDYDLFTRAIYSEQNKLDMFLTIPKGQRMKKIDELLKLNRFESARSSTVSLINSFEASVKELEKVINIMETEKLKEQAIELKRELENKKIEIERMEREFTDIEEQAKAKRLEILEYEKREKKISAIKSQLSALNILNERLKSEILEAEKIKVEYEDEKLASERYERLKSETKMLEEELEKLQKLVMEKSVVVNSLKEKLIETEKLIEEVKRIKSNEKRYEQAKKMFKSITDIINEKTLELKNIQTKIAEAEKSRRELEKTGSQCPVCYQSLTEDMKNKLIEKNIELILSLQRKKSEIEGELEQKKEELTEVELVCREADACEKRLSVIGDAEGRQPVAEGALRDRGEPDSRARQSLHLPRPGEDRCKTG